MMSIVAILEPVGIGWAHIKNLSRICDPERGPYNPMMRRPDGDRLLAHLRRFPPNINARAAS